MTKRRIPWFRAAMIAGFLLGILLVVESFLAYRSVTSKVLPDYLNRQAARYLASVESLARQANVETRQQLQILLDTWREPERENVAWFRIIDPQGGILAVSGDPGKRPIAAEDMRAIFEARVQSLREAVSTPSGEVLVVSLPFRFRLGGNQPRPPAQRLGPPSGTGRLRLNVAEVGMYLHGAEDPFRPLRRNLAVTIAAALALLASMVVMLVRLPTYLRGRALEQQLALARSVQQELLPRGCPACDRLEFSAECLSAWEVGGDYYDVFTKDGQVGLVLGDVSGKGLSAALLMGMLHGAVRAYSRLWSGSNNPEIARDLNQLLHARTSPERFASLFWAWYDPRQQRLSYVNAGHLPPVLARRGADGEVEIHRLETGGPVLGAFPGSSYERGEFALQSGDLLVLYSDGVVEAASSSGEEFGEERLIRGIQSNWSRLPNEILAETIRQVKTFAGPRPLEDDLTIVVARVASEPAGAVA